MRGVTTKMRRTGIARTLAGVAAATGMLLGSLLGTTGTAQAYSPDPTASVIKKSTSGCPCSYSDVIDGTYFEKDVGGQAVKIGLWKSGSYIGKVEYHPYDEQLYVYDNKRDGDAIYVTLTYYTDDGRRIQGPYKGGSTMSSIYHNLSHDDGTYIYVKVWDDSSRTDLIASATAIA